MEPDFAAEGNGCVNRRMRLKQRVEGLHESSDPFLFERKAPRDAHEPVGNLTEPNCFREERAEVGEISCDDRALLRGLGGEVNAIRSSAEAGTLADVDYVVAAVAEPTGNLG